MSKTQPESLRTPALHLPTQSKRLTAKMTKLTQCLAVLTIMYSTVAHADGWNIRVSIGVADHLTVTSKYCIKHLDDTIPLIGGNATFNIVTEGGVFEKCGWVHSSANFAAYDYSGRALMRFEFYKSPGSYPELKVTYDSGLNCSVSDLSVSCI